MIYTQDIGNAFDKIVGENGASTADFDTAHREAEKAIAALHAYKKNNSWPVLNIAEREDDLAQIESAAKRITEHYDTLVVVGMGASSRGGRTLVALTENPFSHMSGKTKIHFIDNIDPYTFDQLVGALDFKKTMFLIISKSGGTAETLAQLLVLLKEVEKRLGKNAIKNHFIFIAEPGKNALRTIGEEHNVEILEHDAGIGGRFASLTAVGLLPAKVAGIDIRAVRKGALDVVKHCFTDKSPEPALGAALHYALWKRGKTVSVMMPYCNRLNAFGAWHQQLWSESLGKNGMGTTALRALGAFDQHSQLQLYLDGPKDKFITLIMLKQEKLGSHIPTSAEKSLGYFKNHTIGDLMGAEQKATAETLTKNNCPNRVFYLDKLNEESLGALMMHFMLETMIMAQIWDIDVFGQPAVEESKQLAIKYLSQS